LNGGMFLLFVIMYLTFGENDLIGVFVFAVYYIPIFLRSI
jgi:hypothetical protein